MRLHIAGLLLTVRDVGSGWQVETLLVHGFISGPNAVPAEMLFPPAACVGVTVLCHVSIHDCELARG